MTTLADYRMPPWMRRTFAPLVPIICTDEAVELGLVDQVLEQVELSMRSFPSFLRFGLIVGTLVFEFGAVFLPSSRFRTFSRMTREQQEKYFRRFWHSKIGAFHQLAKGLKASISLGYWSLPKVLDRMAYHPDRWIAEVAARRVRDYSDDIRKHDALVVAPDPLVQPDTLAKKVKHAKAS
jgi:hypothetical protein